MASANSTPSDHGEDNFVLELRRVREQIKHKFIEMIDCVKARESKLLKQLDIILESYYSYRDEVQKQNKSKRTLEESKKLLEYQLQKSSIKKFHKHIIKLTENEINSIKFPAEPKMVHLVCDNNGMFAELNKLGKLVEKVRSSVECVDYKSKVHPVVSVCAKGSEIEQLYNPWGVIVGNKTGNIYVADCGNECVKVFDGSGKILFKFGDSDGEGKRLYPQGLVISGDIILISNGGYANYYILSYQLYGHFVSKIGKYGKGNVEFNDPYGLACNVSNGDFYICDCHNNRIQIISKELQFKSQFGAGKLKHPHDVKMSKEYIFILDQSNPCIHLYDYNFILQKSVVSRGEGMQVVNSYCFFVDNSNNILISDYSSNSIQIFNSDFELIHKINTSKHPMGVAVDNQGRVIVVCQGNQECLQIF